MREKAVKYVGSSDELLLNLDVKGHLPQTQGIQLMDGIQVHIVFPSRKDFE